MLNSKKALQEIGIVLKSYPQFLDDSSIDTRFYLIRNFVNSVKNKNDDFYGELIKLIGKYIGALCNEYDDFFNGTVLDGNGNIILTGHFLLSNDEQIKIRKANRKFGITLFLYICEILEHNKDIKLDLETLKNLFNRNPKQVPFVVEKHERLAKILNENQTFEKSGISIDDIYQMLIDTFQIYNSKVFVNLITSEDFINNHKKIDEFLLWCNANDFFKVTEIIRNNFDNDFDRLSILRKRNSDNFCEQVIIKMLQDFHLDSNINFIHTLLTDNKIKIDYNVVNHDFSGRGSLKDYIAYSKRNVLIKDLLSNPENVENYYYCCGFMPLYSLYAIIGDYKNALENFLNIYDYHFDYGEGVDDDFANLGYTKMDFIYNDSLANFVKCVIQGLKQTNITYDETKNLISTILDNEKVKYINFEAVLPIVKETLTDEDFSYLIDCLMKKHNEGKLNFIKLISLDNDSLVNGYAIKVISDTELEEVLNLYNKNNSVKSKKLQNKY